MINDLIMKAGYRARLLVPLVRSGETIGALVVRRMEPGEFPISPVELEDLAARSGGDRMAHLFHEMEERTGRTATWEKDEAAGHVRRRWCTAWASSGWQLLGLRAHEIAGLGTGGSAGGIRGLLDELTKRW